MISGFLLRMFIGRWRTMSIKDNVLEVKRRIEAACKRVNRSPEEVILLAASKTRTPSEIVEAFEAGIRVFGENRVQEAMEKIVKLKDLPVEWHMIGHLQKNKAKHAVKLFDLIHSVDSESLALELDKRARSLGKVQRVLIEVKLSPEETKYGCLPEDVKPLVDQILKLDGLRLEGFMTIPPYSENPEDSRVYFSMLREIKTEIEELFSLKLPHLSMGMTNDFEIAIEEGATIVRIGTAIFGKRLYT